MSEYQYYEFQAVDKPLTKKEMQALRNLSTRARITPTSFVNEYNWGDFKGNPLKLVEKYFDAFLYVANWGTRWFMLKLPRNLVDVDLSNMYCYTESAFVHEKGDYLIFEFISEGEDYEWEDDEGWLSALISLRTDIINGDYRALYLSWLCCVQMREVEDDVLEPPIPPNLADLNAPLVSFVEFMRIDTDLIAVAAENSVAANRQTDPKALRNWISNLPENEKDDLLFRMVESPQSHTGSELMHRFQKSVSSKADSKPENQPRSAIDLITMAESYAKERKRRAAEKRARAQARRKREKALARKQYLESLAKRENRIWYKVNAFIESKQPAKYDQAVELLIDLRDLNQMTGDEKAFDKKLEKICIKHYRKSTFLKRLQKVGLGG